MTLFDVYPLNNITITKALGSYVWDENGVQYLDMYGGHAVISIGHTHPHWVKRIEEQLHKIAFYSNSVHIPIQQELANKLAQLSGKENYQLFLVNSGAEANENALKLASFHTGRKKIVAFTKAFHGRTSLAVAATDNPKIVAPVNETGNVDFLPFNDEDALKKYFQTNGNNLAAVIIEGIQGVGGINIANESFLQLIRKLCDENSSVYIADSVQCGYGRSGKFFSHDYAGVNADIYTMAKGMGNGFPVGGILIALGLFTRLTAFVLSGMMAVAYFMAHFPSSIFPVQNGGDAAVLFCFSGAEDSRLVSLSGWPGQPPGSTLFLCSSTMRRQVTHCHQLYPVRKRVNHQPLSFCRIKFFCLTKD